MLESLKDSSIRLVLTRHEQAAGFMAATYGRLTGRVGVCLSTLDPGATHLELPEDIAADQTNARVIGASRRRAPG